MSIATEGEIGYVAGRYYSVGFSQATQAEFLRGATASPPSVRQKLADLLSSAAKLNGVARHAPPPFPCAAIALPPAVGAPGQTLIDMMPGQIKALPLEEFRARFAATDPHVLRPAHIILIDGDKELSAIAHDVLDRKAREKEMEGEPGVTCVRLPKQLETFIAEQIKAGLYGDAGEVISDSLRFFQSETTIHFLRNALGRETTKLTRARERRASELDATTRREAG